MTTAKRKELSKKILEDRQQADENKDQKKKAIENIGTEIDSDKMNREEFLSLNSEIGSLQNEYLYLTGQSKPNFSTSTITYYTGYSKTDSQDLWDGACLKLGNIFYVPNVANSSKLTLDVINETDSDATSNIEPIVPATYSAFASDGTAICPYEYTTAEALSWAITGYNTGYTGTTFADSTRGTTNVGRYASGFSTTSGYGPSLQYGSSASSNYPIFSVNDIVWTNNNSIYTIFKVTASSVSGTGPYNHFVTLKLLTANATPTYPMDFTKVLTAGSSDARALILRAAYQCRDCLLAEQTILNNNVNKNADVLYSIRQLTAFLNAINTWLAMTDANKYLAASLTTLLDATTTRINYISVRSAQISNYLTTSNIFTKRNTIIKLRLKKRSGTLNDIYRAIVSVSSMDGMVSTSSDSKTYYEPKLTVQKGLTDGDNTKNFYVKTSEGFKVNDAVYITDDSGTEMKTKIVGIYDTTMEDEDNKQDIGSNPIAVKQIVLENKYPKTYAKANNVRIMKDIEENEELFLTSIIGCWGSVSVPEIPDGSYTYKSSLASPDGWVPYVEGYYQGYDLSGVTNTSYSTLAMPDVSGNGNAATLHNGTVCSTTVPGNIIYVEKTRSRVRRARIDGDFESDEDYGTKYRVAQGTTITIKGIQRNGSSSYEATDSVVSMPNVLWYHEILDIDYSSSEKTIFSVGPTTGAALFALIRYANHLLIKHWNGSSVVSTEIKNFFYRFDAQNIPLDAVINWTDNSVTIYRNGTFFKKIYMVNAVKPTTNIWYFGNREGLDSSTYSSGYFYDRMIFSRIPTEDEIAKLNSTHTVPSGNCSVTAANNNLIITSSNSQSTYVSIQHPNLPLNGSTMRIAVAYDTDITSLQYYNGSTLVSMIANLSEDNSYYIFQSSYITSTNTTLRLFINYRTIATNKKPAIKYIYIGSGNYTTTYKDISSGYNHGNIHNALPIGKSLSFISPSYVEVPYNSFLTPTDQITIFFSAYSDNWSALPTCSLISKTEGGGYNINAGADKAGNLTFSIRIGTGYVFSHYPLGYITKGWHHIAGVYDGEKVCYYLDGNLVSNIAATGSISYSVNNSLIIGAEVGPSNNPYGNYFTGKIKNIKIYNMGATQAQIKSIIKNI